MYLVGVTEEISKNLHGSELCTIPSILVHHEIKATDCGVSYVDQHKGPRCSCLLKTRLDWLTFTSMFSASQFDV